MPNYKKLKISITQFRGSDSHIVCKFAFIIDSVKHVAVGEINTDHKDVYSMDGILYTIINKYDICKEFDFVVNKAKLQMTENRRFGVDTYNKWGDR